MRTLPKPCGGTRLAAEQGLVDAQFMLGNIYGAGSGVPQDAAEAARWFRLAAEQGHADAQFYLGSRYANGQGVLKDEAEAVRWYRLSADQGNATAQYNLGVSYSTGQGRPQGRCRSGALVSAGRRTGPRHRAK